MQTVLPVPTQQAVMAAKEAAETAKKAADTAKKAADTARRKLESTLRRVQSLRAGVRLGYTCWLSAGPQYETEVEVNAIERLGGEVRPQSLLHSFHHLHRRR